MEMSKLILSIAVLCPFAVGCGGSGTSDPIDAAAPVIDAAPAMADAAAADAGLPDAGIDAGVALLDCSQSVTITSPVADEFFRVGSAISFTALVTDTAGGALEGLSVRWESLDGTLMATTPVDVAGATALDTADLMAGLHQVQARVITPDGACAQTAALPVVLCAEAVDESFDMPLDPAVWSIHRDAYWDSNGWLEMTGISQGQQGAISTVASLVSGGNASIRFSIQTGGGSNPGADGFAMTIIDAVSGPELRALVDSAVSGGGLGYGVGGNYGPWVGDAFTVEIDTWYNIFNGNTEFHTDPTPENHLAITLDGDPGNHIAVAEVPGVEDLQWHRIRTDVVEGHVRVLYDDQLMIDESIPNLAFHGGYIFFSGSTGFYTNYHRFDELSILHECN